MKKLGASSKSVHGGSNITLEKVALDKGLPLKNL